MRSPRNSHKDSCDMEQLPLERQTCFCFTARPTDARSSLVLAWHWPTSSYRKCRMLQRPLSHLELQERDHPKKARGPARRAWSQLGEPCELQQQHSSATQRQDRAPDNVDSVDRTNMSPTDLSGCFTLRHLGELSDASPMPHSPHSNLAFADHQRRQQPERPRLQPSESSFPSGADAASPQKDPFSIFARPRNRPVRRLPSRWRPITKSILSSSRPSDFATCSVRDRVQLLAGGYLRPYQSLIREAVQQLLWSGISNLAAPLQSHAARLVLRSSFPHPCVRGKTASAVTSAGLLPDGGTNTVVAGV